MMSGEFHSIPPEEVIVNRDERIRRSLNRIEELASSIKSTGGLIHPIVLTRENILVAGERRLLACKYLGLTQIPFQYVDELDKKELRLIELEENAKRLDLTPQEEASVIAEIHTILKEEDPTWTQEQTAKRINRERSGVTKYLAIYEERDDPHVKKAKTFSEAAGLAVRKQSRRRADEKFGCDLITDAHIHCVSFLEWAPSYSGPKFNLIHCDFPYGIEADKAQQGTAAKFAEYDDSADIYWQLTHCLIRNIDRICAESAHLIFWFSMKYYEETLILLRECFNIDLFPLIWHKSDNIGLLPDPTRGPRRVYETAFFGSRGDRKIIRAKSNAVSLPTSFEIHPHEKPVSVLQHFMEMLVDGNTRLFDPTCGSGSALRAARALGAETYFGLELNAEYAARANTALGDNI